MSESKPTMVRNDSRTSHRKISFVIRDVPWKSTLWGDVANTTLHKALHLYEAEQGLTPRDIFLVGLDYLSNIRDEHLMVNRGQFMGVEGAVIQELPQLRALRAAGTTNEQIFQAGITHLTAPEPPPWIPDEYQERLLKLKRRGHSDLAIQCAGIHYLSTLPPEIEWELQEPPGYEPEY